ncbi:hypothetical protein GCM10009865_26170 [Aeromicrobium ponti]|uniref:Erythromycin esterase n=1 Tax=Cytobacillus oceanisediminis TaxID=665099 RepID=A0A562JTJ2_9BACI|nr:erythromycin esterase [Cytobacillus oceanisediminis]
MDKTRELIKAIQNEAYSYNTSSDLDRIIDSIGDAKFVLLGEASHGTSEFYTVRTELSKKLIEQKGFNCIAVEGDWPSCFNVNRYVKGYEQMSSHEALQDFNRWPTWMWANEEIRHLTEWLHDFNQCTDRRSQKAGFYGIDVYSLWESMEEIIKLLEKNGSTELEAAKKAFACF